MGADYFEIWNEPNNPAFWSPAPNPAAYTADLIAAYAAIKAVDPSAVVITGGLAPEADSSNSYSIVTFFGDMYADGAQGSFDAAGDHPYTFPADPDSDSQGAWGEMDQTSPSLRSLLATTHGDAAEDLDHRIRRPPPRPSRPPKLPADHPPPLRAHRLDQADISPSHLERPVRRRGLRPARLQRQPQTRPTTAVAAPDLHDRRQPPGADREPVRSSMVIGNGIRWSFGVNVQTQDAGATHGSPPRHSRFCLTGAGGRTGSRVAFCAGICHPAKHLVANGCIQEGRRRKVSKASG